MPLFKRVTIVGVGFLGGSIGLAIKKKKLACEVIGFFRHKHKIKHAIKKGIIDSGTDNFRHAVGDSDFIILCTPVRDIIRRLKNLKSKALITDIGSTKFEIVKTAKGLNFIGSHPLAGSEQSGLAFAQADLFKNSICVLTPGLNKSPHSLEQVREFWRRLGAKTIILNPRTHDHLLAFSSHLPHAVAFSLIRTIPKNAMALASRSLRDMTRIALSKPRLWSDIFLTNRSELLKSIKGFERSLRNLKSAISTANQRQLLALLTQAQRKRKTFASKI